MSTVSLYIISSAYLQWCGCINILHKNYKVPSSVDSPQVGIQAQQL